MNANQMINRMINIELDRNTAADKRHIIRDERLNLQVAAQSGEAQRIGEALREARRVVDMWQGY